MPMGDRVKASRARRLIRFGDSFTEGELVRGEVELEMVDPTPEPADEPDEPWGRLADMPDDHPVRDWVRERLGGKGGGSNGDD